MSGGVGIHELASGYLAILSVYHVWTGAISYFAPEFALRFYRGMYGCDPVERRHLVLVMRPWGALAIFAGLAGGVAFIEPGARPWIVAATALLLALRIGYRLVLRRELAEIARIERRRNLASTAMLAGGLLVLVADLAASLFNL
jgi:hypothetical protein